MVTAIVILALWNIVLSAILVGQSFRIDRLGDALAAKTVADLVAHQRAAGK